MVGYTSLSKRLVLTIMPSERPLAELLRIAWECSVRAYGENATASFTVQGLELDIKVEKSIAASLTGAEKATNLVSIRRRLNETGEEIEDSKDYFPTLLIAVRGTQGAMDNMVNLNSMGTNVEEWLRVCERSEDTPTHFRTSY